MSCTRGLKQDIDQYVKFIIYSGLKALTFETLNFSKVYQVKLLKALTVQKAVTDFQSINFNFKALNLKGLTS
jgi:hypothetical protein